MPSASRMASDPVLYGHGDESDRWLARRSRGVLPPPSDEDEESESEDGDDDDDDDNAATLVLLDEREEAIYHSAMHRIKEARLHGKKEVRLSKKELEIYEQRSKMMAAMNRRQSKQSSSKKKAREERVTVPIDNLDVPKPTSHKKKLRGSGDAPPKHTTPSKLTDNGEDDSFRLTGRFYPPAAPGSGARRTSGRSPSPQARDRGSSREPTPDRRVSDNALGYPSARSSYSPMEYEDPWVPEVPPDRTSVADPFQYQTAGPRAPYPSGSPPGSRRSLISPADRLYSDYSSRRGDPTDDDSEAVSGAEDAYAEGRARETRSRIRERDGDRDRPSARSSGLAGDGQYSSSTTRRKRSPAKRKPIGASGGATTSGATSGSSSSRRKR